jgi:hypothetical protein
MPGRRGDPWRVVALPVAIAVALLLTFASGSPVSAGRPSAQSPAAGPTQASAAGATGVARAVSTGPRGAPPARAASTAARVAPARPAGVIGRVLLDGLAQLAQAPASRRVDAGLLRASGSGDVAVSIRLEPTGRTDALLAAAAVGARIANSDGGGVEAYVPATSLAALAAIPGVLSVAPIRPVVPAAALSTAVTLHGADTWHAAGFTGGGVRVGIIDAGFSGIASLLGVALPASVHARCYTAVGVFTSNLSACGPVGENHGTAVAESLAAMAPGASLWIADPTSQDDLAATVDWMTGNGVRIINASWTEVGFDGPGDGTSPYADSSYALVDRAVAGGAIWVNAAGNAGEDGWVGPWADGGNGRLAFSGGDTENRLTLQQSDQVSVSLRWSDPWGSASDDLDLGLYANGSDVPVASSTNVQDGAGDPVESLSYDVPATGGYYVAVHRRSGGSPARIQLLVQTQDDAPLQYRTPGDTLASPADSRNPGMLTVGAVKIGAPSTVEPYSSRGPTLDGRVKPDLVAADCADTTSIPQFCGTSQSTPFVAGAAADLLGGNPTWSNARVLQALTSGAVPIGAPVPNDAAGFGRLALGDPPSVAAALRFVDVPIGGIAGAVLPVQPAVEIVNAAGGRVTAGPDSALPVSLALSGVAGAALACAGSTTAAAVRGLATFTGCTVSAPAPGAQLSASAGALPATTSPPFDVVGPDATAAALVLGAGSGVVTWGSAAGVTVRAAQADGAAAADVPVGLQVSTDRVEWTGAGIVTTGLDGIARFPYRPATNLWYRAILRPVNGLGPALSNQARVVVRQIALLRPASGGAPRTIARGTTVTFSTTVRPSRPELARPRVTYAVYRLAGARWVLATEIAVQADALGVARLVWRFGTAGSWRIRALAAPTPLNANSAWAPFEAFLVR